MVTEFLKDGHFSKDEYLQLELAVDLHNFTVCARAKVFFLRGRDNFFLSYANNVTDDAFHAVIKANLANGTQAFQVVFCKYPYITGECVRFSLNYFNFNHWMHFCALFTSVHRSPTEVESTVQLFVDGNLAKSGNT